MDRYNARLSILGNSRREREIRKKQDYVIRNGIQSPSLKNVLIEGEERQLFVNTGTKPYYKEIQSLPNEVFYVGQIVEWEDNHWLIMDSDFDDEVYVDGTMDQCNYCLRWQNEKLDIIERWVRIGEASAYNTGTKGDLTIEIGYDQMKIYIPYDEETVKLRREQKFFIDNNKENPTPYKITRVDTVTDVYNGHGLISAIFSEVQLTDKDNIELMICDYKEKINDESSATCTIESNNQFIMAGYNKGSTFKAIFSMDGETIDEGVIPVWTINCDFISQLTVIEDEDYINISTEDESLIGRNFTLTLSSYRNEYEPTNLLVEIVGIN